MSDVPTMEEMSMRQIREMKGRPREDFSGGYLISKSLNYESDRLYSKWIYMRHKDGYTYQEIGKVGLSAGGGIYIEHRYTEITDPIWYQHPILWLKKRLP